MATTPKTKVPKPALEPAKALPAASKRKRGGQPMADRAKHCADLIPWLEEGKTLREFCRQPGRPSYGTIYDWMDQDEAFSSRVARARDTGFEAIAEEALQIANTPVEGKRIKVSEDGTEITKEDMLGHRKLQIETRLKLLACWNPKKYGQKQLIGSDPENPIVPPETTELFGEILKGLALQRAAQNKKG